MSGLVSVSWKRHCIYICQHNVWQNIFLKLAFLPENFTRTHACAHVPAIWCSYTLLSWRVKIRCTFHVRSLHKVLLTCKRCLARALVWRSRASVLYICIPWDERVSVCVYLMWRQCLLRITGFQSQPLDTFPGTPVLCLNAHVVLLTGILRYFVDELRLCLDQR